MEITIDTIYNMDCLEGMRMIPDGTVDCCVTSPPYFALRDYGTEGQIGLEQSPEEYIDRLTDVFREVLRVLKPEGTCWVVIGDSYAGANKGAANYPENAKLWKQGSNKGTLDKATSYRYRTEAKDRDLIGIPWMLAFALRRIGFYLRQDIIWCLSGGTYVYAKTTKGVMPMTIKDLVRLNPKTVQLWNGFRWVDVLGYGESNDTSDRIELVLRSGERIECTGNHKWVLSDGQQVAAKDLKVGDVLKTCTLPDCDLHTPRFMTKDVLWLLGLYLAEGSLSDDCIQLALNTDETRWIERISEVATYLGGTCTHDTKGNELSVRIYSQVLLAVIHQYIGGRNAKTKHLNNVCWKMPNEWLKCIVEGYFDGDGNYDEANNRIRLGFTRNYYLERDLRILAARLDASISLRLSSSFIGNKKYPTFKGEWRWGKSHHHNEKDRAEIVEIRKSKGRHFYDISVDGEDHLFSLASGVLTHNCKPNPMPESVKSRCTKSHEYVFLLTKSPRYYFNEQALREPANTGVRPNEFNHRKVKFTVPGHRQEQFRGSQNANDGKRNQRDVWSILVKPGFDGHHATFPTELPRRCLSLGCPEGGTALDPFMGSGTTAVVARALGMHYIGFELSPDYCDIIRRRLEQTKTLFDSNN